MRLAVLHETVYRFANPASHAIQTLRLTPRNTESQLIQNWRIDVSQDCRLSPVEDAFGNLTHTFSIDGPIEELSIVASGVVVTEDTAGVLHTTRDRLPRAVYGRVTDRTRAEIAVRDLAETARRESGGDLLSALHLLMGQLNERVELVEDAPTRLPDAVLAKGQASLADLVDLFAAATRALDIPTRVIGGLIFRDGGEEQSAGHQWIEAYVGPSLGWIGFDAVENCCPTDRWIRITTGLDTIDVAPIRGVRSHVGEETVSTRIVLRDIGPA